jgi:hypothetical protein
MLFKHKHLDREAEIDIAEQPIHPVGTRGMPSPPSSPSVPSPLAPLISPAKMTPFAAGPTDNSDKQDQLRPGELRHLTASSPSPALLISVPLLPMIKQHRQHRQHRQHQQHQQHHQHHQHQHHHQHHPLQQTPDNHYSLFPEASSTTLSRTPWFMPTHSFLCPASQGAD